MCLACRMARPKRPLAPKAARKSAPSRAVSSPRVPFSPFWPVATLGTLPQEWTGFADSIIGKPSDFSLRAQPVRGTIDIAGDTATATRYGDDANTHTDRSDDEDQPQQHQDLLARHSGVFRTMFEDAGKSSTLETTVVLNIAPDLMYALLDFIYNPHHAAQIVFREQA